MRRCVQMVSCVLLAGTWQIWLTRVAGHSETVKRVDFGDDGSRFAGGACLVGHLRHPRLQGYLAHKKQPNPLGQQMDP